MLNDENLNEYLKRFSGVENYAINFLNIYCCNWNHTCPSFPYKLR